MWVKWFYVLLRIQNDMNTVWNLWNAQTDEVSVMVHRENALFCTLNKRPTTEVLCNLTSCFPTLTDVYSALLSTNLLPDTSWNCSTLELISCWHWHCGGFPLWGQKLWSLYQSIPVKAEHTAWWCDARSTKVSSYEELWW